MEIYGNYLILLQSFAEQSCCFKFSYYFIINKKIMKKLLIIFAVLFFGIKSASAKLSVTNNTACYVSFCVFCHDAAHSTCGYYQSQAYTLAPGAVQIFYSTNDFGPSYYYPNYVDFAYPGDGNGYDYVKFWTEDGSVNLGSVGIGTCAPGTSWTGPSNWCGGGPLHAAISVFGPHQNVVFSN